jgi:hypothetical protein
VRRKNAIRFALQGSCDQRAFTLPYAWRQKHRASYGSWIERSRASRFVHGFWSAAAIADRREARAVVAAIEKLLGED